MNQRICNCVGTERELCALRAKLSDGQWACPTLATWERELYMLNTEPEPYVDLTVTLSDFRQVSFHHVRGISVKDRVTTCEDEQGVLFYVPDTLFYQTEYCEQH